MKTGLLASECSYVARPRSAGFPILTLLGILFFLSFLAGACAGRQKTGLNLHDEQVAFSSLERSRVHQGKADAPMEVVNNATAEGDVFLRSPSRRVEPGDPDLAHLLARMQATVRAEKGVGIAAVQVGVARRVVLVQRLDLVPDQAFRAYFNPEIVRMSDESILGWEGCLSVPAGYGRVRRAASVTLAHDTQDGRHQEEVSGFTARIFQHELDHLDGILFVDRMEPGDLIPEDEYRKMRKRQSGKDEPQA